MIGLAQESDRAELVELYRRSHQGTLSRPLRLRPELDSQTFVVKEHGKIIGMVIVSHISVGTTAYGIIHELDVMDGFDTGRVGRLLANTCRAWLGQRGTTAFYTLPALHVPGAEVLTTTGERRWDWILTAGEYHPVPGPSGAPPGPPPESRQAVYFSGG